jgi:hypothetical protein
MIEAVLATCLLGQVCYDAPVVIYQQPSPVVVAPPLYIDYVGVTQPYRSKFYDTIHYKDGKFRRVPIINGWVPGVTYTRYYNGAERIVYNYCHRIRYEDVRDIGKVRTRPRPQPTRPQPRPQPPKQELVPIPEPVKPPKPTLAPPQEEDDGWKPALPRPMPERPPALPRTESPVLPGQRDPGDIDEPRMRVRPTYRDD